MKKFAMAALAAVSTMWAPAAFGAHRPAAARAPRFLSKAPTDHVHSGIFIGAYGGSGHRPGHHRDFGFDRR